MSGYNFQTLFCAIISFLTWIDMFKSLVTPMMVEKSPLQNRILNIAAIEGPSDFVVIRNSTGHIIQFDGLSWLVIEWLSAAYINTTFNVIPINLLKFPLDAIGDKPGLLDLVGKGVYDFVTSSAPTSSRAATVDYTNPNLYFNISFLIPSPGNSVNILSFTKPFDNWVWFSLFLSILLVFASTMLAISSGPYSVKTIKRRHFKTEMSFYLFGALLHQAMTYRFSKKLAIRIIIATWSLAAFLFVNYYDSLCISFLAIPIKKPLIESIYELRNRPEIRLVMDKNRNVQALLLSAESGIFKELGDRVRADPGSLCTESSQCVDLVKEGHAVYTGARSGFLLKVLKEDFEATGKCNMELAKENYMQLQLSWASQKKSPYLNSLNKSFMRINEAGLLQKWVKDRRPKVEECFPSAKMKRGQTVAEGREPLPLKGFWGAFIVLAAGTVSALMVFIIETCITKRVICFT